MPKRCATWRRILPIAVLGWLGLVAAPAAAVPPLLPARLIKDLTDDVPALYPQNVWVRELTRVGNRIFFIASGFTAEQADHELWVTDGSTAGTRRLTTLNAKPPFRQIHQLRPIGDRLYFVYGSALWIMDTTTDTAKPLSPQSTYPYAGIADPMPAGALLYYRFIDHDSWLCRSDGTPPGTFCLFDGVEGFGMVLGNTLLFVADYFNREPWATSDGQDPRLLRDIAPGDFSPSRPTGWTRFGGAAFFFASDGAGDQDLYRTDGTPDGTRRAANIDVHLCPNFIGTPPAIDLRGHLYFTASDATHTCRLWRSDATLQGTVPLAAGPDGAGELLAIARAGGRLLALNGEGWDQAALWAYDPSSGASERLAPVISSWRDAITELGGHTVFTSCTLRRGCEPWISDGTVAGTYQLADVAPRAKNAYPTFYTRLGAEILFAASDGTGPSSLWAISAPVDDACSGDCSGDGEVSIDELISGIGITIGDQGIDRCAAMDRAGDGSVAIDDLIAAVGHALEGCYG
jgi:ELWxxDGT repeat protein